MPDPYADLYEGAPVATVSGDPYADLYNEPVEQRPGTGAMAPDPRGFLRREVARVLDEAGSGQGLQALPRGAEAIARALLRNTPAGDIQAGAEQGATDLIRTAGVATGNMDLAREAGQEAQRIEEQRAAETARIPFAWDAGAQGVRGAARSLTSQAPAMGAGPAGMIALAMGNQGAGSYADATEAGLPADEAVSFALRQAGYEGLPAAVMQRMGLGGLEKVLADLAKQGVGTMGLAQLARQFLVSTGQELPEELVTTAMQTPDQAITLRGEAPSGAEWADALGQTALQTAIMGGMSHAPQAASLAANTLDEASRRTVATGEADPITGVIPTAPDGIAAQVRALLNRAARRAPQAGMQAVDGSRYRDDGTTDSGRAAAIMGDLLRQLQGEDQGTAEAPQVSPGAPAADRRGGSAPLRLQDVLDEERRTGGGLPEAQPVDLQEAVQQTAERAPTIKPADTPAAAPAVGSPWPLMSLRQSAPGPVAFGTEDPVPGMEDQARAHVERLRSGDPVYQDNLRKLALAMRDAGVPAGTVIHNDLFLPHVPALTGLMSRKQIRHIADQVLAEAGFHDQQPQESPDAPTAQPRPVAAPADPGRASAGTPAAPAAQPVAPAPVEQQRAPAGGAPVAPAFQPGQRVRFTRGERKGQEATVTAVTPDGRPSVRADDGRMFGGKGGVAPTNVEAIPAATTTPAAATAAPAQPVPAATTPPAPAIVDQTAPTAPEQPAPAAEAPSTKNNTAAPAPHGQPAAVPSRLPATEAGNLINPRPAAQAPAPVVEPPKEPKASSIATAAAGMKPKQSKAFNEAVTQATTDVAVRIDGGETGSVKLTSAALAWLRDVDVGHSADGKPTKEGLAMAREIVARARESQQRRAERRADEADQGAQPAVELSQPEAPPVVSGEPAVRPTQDGIQDFGEKIGGARKDTATTSGAKPRKAAADERPAWARRYEVAQVAASSQPGEVGRWTVRDSKDTDWKGQARQVGGTYGTKEEAEASIPLAAVARAHRVTTVNRTGEPVEWAIVRRVSDTKRKAIKRGFSTEEEAKRYLAQHPVEILDTETSLGEEILAKPEKVIRSGPGRRTGDVGPQDFTTAFGFRGVEFGNWNNQDERQELMNHAYDGFMDLADVLGIPPRAISLNGELALAFGARGHGLSGARAHYERRKAVINLTKMKGAGALAHEWWHALDHYLGRQDGKAPAAMVDDPRGGRMFPDPQYGTEMASDGFSRSSQVRAELRDAFNQVMSTLTRKAETYIADTAKAEEFVGKARDEVDGLLRAEREHMAKERAYGSKKAAASPEQLARWDATADAVLNGDPVPVEWKHAGGKGMAHQWSNQHLDVLTAIRKEVTGRGGRDSQDHRGPMDRIATAVKHYQQRAKMLADARTNPENVRKVPTEYLQNAKEIDQGRATDYWTTPTELAARAFSAFTEDTLAERGQGSGFLSFGSDNWRYALLDIRPFPAGEERKAMDAAFRQFLDTVKVEETPQGTTRLYQSDPVPGGDLPAGTDPVGADQVPDGFNTAGRGDTRAQRFVLAPDGGLDWGAIDAEVSHAINRQAGPIRLQVGWHGGPGSGFGLVHLRLGAKRAGGDLSLLSRVLTGYQEVRDAGGGRLALVLRDDGRGETTIITLVPGDHYSVISSMAKSERNLGRMPLLWPKSETAERNPGRDPLPESPDLSDTINGGKNGPPLARPQSNDGGSIPQDEAPGKPGDPRLFGREIIPGEHAQPANHPKAPPVHDGIEAVIAWAKVERERVIGRMGALMAKAKNREAVNAYGDVRNAYQSVDPDELAEHMRQFPGHYLRAATAAGGHLDPIQVFVKRESLPPLEPRVMPAPLAGEQAPSHRESLRELNQALRSASRSAPSMDVDRGLSGKAGGFYDPSNQRVVVKYHNDLDLVAHEVGHWAAETWGLLPPGTTEDGRKVRAELARLGVHGSKAQGERLLREGMAEGLRAWMVNPSEAERRAPGFLALMQEAVPPPVLAALRAYGDNVRRFAGSENVAKVGAGVLGTKEGMAEERRNGNALRMAAQGLAGVFGFGKKERTMRPGIQPTGWARDRWKAANGLKEKAQVVMDQARFQITDREATMMANYLMALELAGIDPAKLSPVAHWNVMRTGMLGQNGRIRDMVTRYGLAMPDLSVSVDQKTGERMNLAWLLDPITAKALEDADFTRLIDRAHAYGVAQRTLELEERWTRQTEAEIAAFIEARSEETGDRSIQVQDEIAAYAKEKRDALKMRLARITGAGAGIESSTEVARKAVAELENDPDRDIIREYLRRYRAWSTWNLDYAVASDLLTKEQAARMKRGNQFYIDWHRVFGEDDAPIDIGEAVDGSMRTIHNPLASLLHATWSAVTRGDRNRLMLAFTAPLRLAQAGDGAMAQLGRQISAEEAEKAKEQQGYHDDATGERRRVYRLQRTVQAVDEHGQPTMENGSPVQEVVTEHWVFDAGTEASLEAGRSIAGDHPWMVLMRGLNGLQRSMITLAPGFRLKVPVRDSMEQLMNSEARNSPAGVVKDTAGILRHDIDLDGRSLDELFSLSGASMAGYNAQGREAAIAEVAKTVEEMRAQGIRVLSADGLTKAWHLYQKFGEEAENLARKREFLAVYREKRAQGMTIQEAAALAMASSRDLLDTAKAGNLTGRMNGIVLFLNASVQGMAKNTKMARAAAAAVARGDHAVAARLAAVLGVRLASFAAVSVLARMAWLAAMDDDEERKKALREPAFKRDFAFRFNVPGIGPVAVPKPYEWGFITSGFDRLADYALAKSKGWDADATNAYDGYAGSFAHAIMPLDQDMVAGSFAPIIEVLANHSFFTGGSIVAPHETGLVLDDRKGQENASSLGRGLGAVLRTDARNVDHLIRGYFGGFGSMATARTWGEFAKRTTGYSGSTSLYASRDVEWVMEEAARRGGSQRAPVQTLRKLLKAERTATTEDDRQRAERRALEMAARLRGMMEKNPNALRKSER